MAKASILVNRDDEIDIDVGGTIHSVISDSGMTLVFKSHDNKTTIDLTLTREDVYKVFHLPGDPRN